MTQNLSGSALALEISSAFRAMLERQSYELQNVRWFMVPEIAGYLNSANGNCEELSKLPDYLRQEDANAIGAIMRLPIPLRQPAMKSFCMFLQKETQGKVGAVRVRDIFRALGLPVPEALTPSTILDIGRLIEMSCYQYAPNFSLHGVSFSIHDMIYLAPALSTPENSGHFSLMAVIMRMGAVIAQCDENVAQEEIDILQKLIVSRRVLDDGQRASLLLLLHWCLNTPQKLDDLQEALTGIDESLRDRISKILVDVACADGVIDPRERKFLVTLHKMLGLPETWVELALAEQNNIQIPDCNGIQIPSCEDISFTSSSTHQADSNSENIIGSLRVEVPECGFVKAPENVLDGAHKAFLTKLSGRTAWPRFDVFEAAISFHLMADWAMQKINRVATARLGAEIITDGDIVTVDVERAKHLSLS